jgi:hypothetical protein
MVGKSKQDGAERLGNAFVDVGGLLRGAQRIRPPPLRARTLHCCSVTTSSLCPTARLSSTARVAKMSRTPPSPPTAQLPSPSCRWPPPSSSSRARFEFIRSKPPASSYGGGTGMQCCGACMAGLVVVLQRSLVLTLAVLAAAKNPCSPDPCRAGCRLAPLGRSLPPAPDPPPRARALSAARC